MSIPELIGKHDLRTNAKSQHFIKAVVNSSAKVVGLQISVLWYSRSIANSVRHIFK